jgi:hypothetical protein
MGHGGSQLGTAPAKFRNQSQAYLDQSSKHTDRIAKDPAKKNTENRKKEVN